MKSLKKFVPFVSLTAIVAPIATVISCGTSQLGSVQPSNLVTPREVKVEVPDELFPGVKQDPVKFDEIKNKLLSYTESYDQDGNYILENDDVIFKFDKDSFGADKIPDTDFTKEIFKASMQQINSITTHNYSFSNRIMQTRKKTIEFVGKSFNNGAYGFAENSHASINIPAADIGEYKPSDYDIAILDIAHVVTHEFVHMQESELIPQSLNDRMFLSWINRFKSETSWFMNDEMKKWADSLQDDDSIANSLSTLGSRLNHYRDFATNPDLIKPLDFMGVAGTETSWPFRPLGFEGSLTGYPLMHMYLENEFFAHLNTTFTQHILKNKFTDFHHENTIGRLISVPLTFGLNFFDITKPRQAYDIMKPFIEEIYRVSKKPLVSFEGSTLHLRGVGFPQLDTLDHYKIFFNGKEVISHKFVKKDVAIGFNRNPFTPNEYKYVTKSIDNYFSDAAIGNQLGLTATNTELKFYDINNNEIALDYENDN